MSMVQQSSAATESASHTFEGTVPANSYLTCQPKVLIGSIGATKKALLMLREAAMVLAYRPASARTPGWRLRPGCSCQIVRTPTAVGLRHCRCSAPAAVTLKHVRCAATDDTQNGKHAQTLIAGHLRTEYCIVYFRVCSGKIPQKLIGKHAATASLRSLAGQQHAQPQNQRTAESQQGVALSAAAWSALSRGCLHPAMSLLATTEPAGEICTRAATFVWGPSCSPAASATAVARLPVPAVAGTLRHHAGCLENLGQCLNLQTS